MIPLTVSTVKESPESNNTAKNSNSSSMISSTISRCAVLFIGLATTILVVFNSYRSPLLLELAKNDAHTKQNSHTHDESSSTSTIVQQQSSSPALDADDIIPRNYSIIAQEYPDCASTINATDEIRQMLQQQPPWNDMDWEGGVDGQGHAACGNQKCYLHSKSDPHAGYLMAVAYLMKAMTQTTEIQMDLQETMGAHVLVLPGETPEMIHLSLPSACFLTEYFRQSVPHNPLKKYPLRRRIIVHKVQRAPEPNFLLGTNFYKVQDFVDGWALFLQNNHANATAAYHQLTSELDKMPRIFDKYPTLVCDYQALLDVHGNLYHMDVDRMFSKGCWENNETSRHANDYATNVPAIVEAARQAALDYEQHTGVFAD